MPGSQASGALCSPCSVSKSKESSRQCFWRIAPIHLPDMSHKHLQAVLSACRLCGFPDMQGSHRSHTCPCACLQILREQQALLLEGSPAYLAAMSQEEHNANRTVDGLPPKRSEPASRPGGPHLAEWPEDTDLQQVGAPPPWHSRYTAAAALNSVSRHQQARSVNPKPLCTGRVQVCLQQSIQMATQLQHSCRLLCCFEAETFPATSPNDHRLCADQRLPDSQPLHKDQASSWCPAVERCHG